MNSLLPSSGPRSSTMGGRVTHPRPPPLVGLPHDAPPPTPQPLEV